MGNMRCFRIRQLNIKVRATSVKLNVLSNRDTCHEIHHKTFFYHLLRCFTITIYYDLQGPTDLLPFFFPVPSSIFLFRSFGLFKGLKFKCLVIIKLVNFVFSFS